MKNIGFACLLILLMLTSCQKDARGAILAEVNGEVLELEVFKATLAEGEWEALDSASRRRYVEDWVNLTLLAQAAQKEGMDQDPAVKARVSYASKKVKANALIAERMAQMRISEDQLFSYFRIHQAEFQKPTLIYDIQRIQLPDKLAAENVLSQVNQGFDFDLAVTRFSTENLRMQGGRMGFVEPNSADSLFWLAARELEIKQAGIVTKDNLWYVFRYTDTRESDKEAMFEEHRAEIRRRILFEKQEEVYRNILREIKAENHEIYYY